MLKEWIRKIIIKRIRNSPANRLNVLIVSMSRCGTDAVGDKISEIHDAVYGVPIKWSYVEDPSKATSYLVEGWSGIYDVNPLVALQIPYDKVILISRSPEELLKAQYLYYIESTQMKLPDWIRDKFLATFALLYDQLYQQNIKNNPKIFELSLEQFNSHTQFILEEVCKFLEFDMKAVRKRVVIIPVQVERSWEVYSTNLESNQEISDTLSRIKQMKHDGEVRRRKERAVQN